MKEILRESLQINEARRRKSNPMKEPRIFDEVICELCGDRKYVDDAWALGWSIPKKEQPLCLDCLSKT